MNINSDSFDCGHEECEEEELKVLELTRDEVLYIDDRLTMMIERDGRSENFTTVTPISANAGLPSPVDLLDKVGMAVLQATEEDYDRETLISLPVTPIAPFVVSPLPLCALPSTTAPAAVILNPTYGPAKSLPAAITDVVAKLARRMKTIILNFFIVI